MYILVMIIALYICDHHAKFVVVGVFLLPLLDALEGWAEIVHLPNCVVYQKLYKETGLFQYKVIGSYDDITARDFIDVQVQYTVR